jgi:hypothetical protein
MTSPQKLARFVEPALPEARVVSQWAGVVDLESTGRRRRRAAVALAGSAVLLALVLMVATRSKPPDAVALAGSAMESGTTSAQWWTLPDGSRVRLGSSTRVSIATARRDSVRLVLERGSAQFEVKHDENREFCVTAGGFDVSVVGTRFEVALGDKPRLRVSVREGRVKVRRSGGAGDVTILSAGESWVDGPASAVAAPSATAAASAPPVGSAVAVGATGPKELFELAEAARLRGRLREAAEALDQLRRRYRGDGRAGLAAFELGRLRMDSLGDPAGAAEALRDAIALAPGSSFREDAEARLVQAYQATGDRRRCRAAREAYLASHPRGAHARVVARQCGEP